MNRFFVPNRIALSECVLLAEQCVLVARSTDRVLGYSIVTGECLGVILSGDGFGKFCVSARFDSIVVCVPRRNHVVEVHVRFDASGSCSSLGQVFRARFLESPHFVASGSTHLVVASRSSELFIFRHADAVMVMYVSLVGPSFQRKLSNIEYIVPRTNNKGFVVSDENYLMLFDWDGTQRREFRDVTGRLMVYDNETVTSVPRCRRGALPMETLRRHGVRESQLPNNVSLVCNAANSSSSGPTVLVAQGEAYVSRTPFICCYVCQSLELRKTWLCCLNVFRPT